MSGPDDFDDDNDIPPAPTPDLERAIAEWTEWTLREARAELATFAVTEARRAALLAAIEPGKRTRELVEAAWARLQSVH